MATDALPERRRWQLAVGGVLATLAVANVMSNRVLPSWAYVPWSLVVALTVVMIARRSVSMDQMGFTEWRRGAAWGGVLFALTLVVLAVAALMPVFSEMYHDRRVNGGAVEFVYQALIRIPFGTAVLEETAFRAVLPALFAVRWGVLRGCVAASVCFGLWHVLPSLGLTKVNPAATRILGSGHAGVVAAVVFAVVGTALAGLWWCWIRYRARSILATMVAHVATNSVAYTIAWLVTR
ncbi:MAG: CPBP family intramembrane metalloprotease [Ilumatobacteraceae bacterium]|nr:CPBP family intramembrane metalloprotease [Ilumatobacteraceae bacterium]